MNMKRICYMINVKVGSHNYSQYYDHNETIRYPLGNAVQLYDQYDRLLGEMSLKEAMSRAHTQKLDLVMRNSATNPATVKLMNYKREVFRKLLLRLGKRFAEGREIKNGRVRKEEEIYRIERQHQVTWSSQPNQNSFKYSAKELNFIDIYARGRDKRWLSEKGQTNHENGKILLIFSSLLSLEGSLKSTKVCIKWNKCLILFSDILRNW